jgi:hypothetical protein
MWQDRDMQPIVPRLFAALPDAITAAVFLIAWVAPTIPGPEYVTNLTLVMLIEFIVMHSSGFYAGIAASGELARGKRALMLTGLTGLYLTFIVAFALAFASTWPIFAFAWLFASRFIHIWTHPVQSADETARMLQLWAVSVVAYIFGALATVFLPLPRLGMTPQFVASMHLSGSGEWIDRPYTVLAFGLLYFAAQAWAKYALSGDASPRSGAPANVFAQRITRIASVAGRRQQEP